MHSGKLGEWKVRKIEAIGVYFIFYPLSSTKHSIHWEPVFDVVTLEINEKIFTHRNKFTPNIAGTGRSILSFIIFQSNL